MRPLLTTHDGDETEIVLIIYSSERQQEVKYFLIGSASIAHNTLIIPLMGLDFFPAIIMSETGCAGDTPGKKTSVTGGDVSGQCPWAWRCDIM